MKRFLVMLGVLCLALAGCSASGPTISAAQSPGVDFSQFETFNYMPILGTDRANGTRTPFSNRLIEAMNHEMSVRGLRLSDYPDLWVDFNFAAQERIDIRQTPNMSWSAHRSHWNHRYSVWAGYQTTVRQYTEGTFLVDIVDVRNATLIGEGAAQGRMRQELRDIPQEDINAVMANIMAELMP